MPNAILVYKSVVEGTISADHAATILGVPVEVVLIVIGSPLFAIKLEK